MTTGMIVEQLLQPTLQKHDVSCFIQSVFSLCPAHRNLLSKLVQHMSQQIKEQWHSGEGWQQQHPTRNK